MSSMDCTTVSTSSRGLMQFDFDSVKNVSGWSVGVTLLELTFELDETEINDLDFRLLIIFTYNTLHTIAFFNYIQILVCR